MDNNQPVTDFEDKNVKKQNKRAVKRKPRLINLLAFVRALATGFAAPLLSHCAPVSCFGSPASLTFCPGSSTCLSPLFPCLRTRSALSSRLVSALVPRSQAILSSLPMLSSTPPHLTSTALRIFKQTLLNKSLHRSTSLEESFCPVPPLGLLPDKTDCKQTFDIAFINSCLLTGNSTQEMVDIGFAKCGCLATVKLNWSCQLELLDPKLV